LKKIALLFLSTCGLVTSCRTTETLSGPAAIRGATSGGAHIAKPFVLDVKGAECFSGSGNNAGDVAFGFPNRAPRARLMFTIGPLRDGNSPGQESNKPYSGPGDYPNVGIVGNGSGLNPTWWKGFSGHGTITVNADEESGSFRLADGSASGTWNCGHKLQR